MAALRAAANQSPDVIILARGGGSLEDLWCFNDERVVRAIVASPVPVVSGVGHETDFTLADFAADLRAPTPSAAAELATPDGAQTPRWWTTCTARLTESALRSLRDQRWALAQQQAHLRSLSPLAALRSGQQRLDDLPARAAAALGHRVALDRQRWHGLAQALGTSARWPCCPRLRHRHRPGWRALPAPPRPPPATGSPSASAMACSLFT